MPTRKRSSVQVSCVQMHWGKPIEFNLERTLRHIGAAAEEGSRIVLFPEANLTSYYFPYLVRLKPAAVKDALDKTRKAAAQAGIWAIAGTIQKTGDRCLNLADVISTWPGCPRIRQGQHGGPGREEILPRRQQVVTVRDRRDTLHSCHLPRWETPGVVPHSRHGRRADSLPSFVQFRRDRSRAWKRVSGRAQQPVGPNTKIFHCVANTVGQDPDGKQTSSGQSFIREPNGIPLAEAGCYQEEMITAVLDLSRADRSYVLDSMKNPPFLRKYWAQMVKEVKARADGKPRYLLPLACAGRNCRDTPPCQVSYSIRRCPPLDCALRAVHPAGTFASASMPTLHSAILPLHHSVAARQTRRPAWTHAAPAQVFHL